MLLSYLPMNILYLSQYFPPEIGATQTRAYEMARGLILAGHHVTMITEVPNHPTGVIPSEYRGRLYERTNENGIDVIRVWVKASPVKRFRSRMAFYLSYMFMATLAGIFIARGKYHLIYATSPPLFVGAAALIISYLRFIPLVFEVRDLWPKSAVALGELRNPFFIRLAEKLEWCCYRHSRRVVVVTEGIRRHLLGRGMASGRLQLIPNGARTDLFIPGPIDQNLRKQLRIAEDAFVAVYTGLHGLIHGMEIILQAAKFLQARGMDERIVQFLLVGDGVAKPKLIAEVRKMSLTNIRFLEAQPEVTLPRFIRLANVGLATTAKLSLTEGSLPVKMFSYMACARPVLLAVDGEARKLLEAAKAGLYITPENGTALAKAIVELMLNPTLCDMLGKNGRRFVEAHYSRESQSRKLGRLLREVVKERH